MSTSAPPLETAGAGPKPSRRRSFGRLTCTVLALLPVALYWRLGVGGWEGFKESRNIREQADAIAESRVKGTPRQAGERLAAFGSRATPAMLRLLGARTTTARLAGIEALRLTMAPTELIKTLEPYCNDDDAAVCTLAVRASADAAFDLGKAGLGAAEWARIRRLTVREWHSGDPAQCIEVALVLGKYGGEVKEVGASMADAILQLVGTNLVSASSTYYVDRAKLGRIYQALSIIDPERAERVGLELVSAIEGNVSLLRSKAFEILEYSAPFVSRRVRERLAEWLDRNESFVWVRSAGILLAYHDDLALKAERALRSAILDPNRDPHERQLAFSWSRSRATVLDESDWQRLIDQLAVSDDNAKETILWMLRPYANRLAFPADFLLDLIDDPGVKTRTELVRLFTSRKSPDPRTARRLVPACLDWIFDRSIELAYASQEYLGSESAHSREFLDPLLRAYERFGAEIHKARPPIADPTERHRRRRLEIEIDNALFNAIGRIDPETAESLRRPLNRFPQPPGAVPLAPIVK